MLCSTGCPAFTFERVYDVIFFFLSVHTGPGDFSPRAHPFVQNSTSVVHSRRDQSAFWLYVGSQSLAEFFNLLVLLLPSTPSFRNLVSVNIFPSASVYLSLVGLGCQLGIVFLETLAQTLAASHVLLNTARHAAVFALGDCLGGEVVDTGIEAVVYKVAKKL